MPEMDENSMDDLKPQGGNKKPTKVNNGQYLVETTNAGKNKNQYDDDADSDISETNSYKVFKIKIIFVICM